MNPPTGERPTLQLPTPVAGAEQTGQIAANSIASPETGASPEYMASAPTAPAPAFDPASIAPVAVSQTVVQQSTTATPAAITATPLDDADLIEKEWVSKAKQIVERNREDPYQQSKEMTVFRADYMQQHYQKTIKTSE